MRCGLKMSAVLTPHPQTPTPKAPPTRNIWAVTMILPICAIFAILDLAVSLIMDHLRFIAVYSSKMTIAFAVLTILYSVFLLVGVHAQKWRVEGGVDSEALPSVPSAPPSDSKECFAHWTALAGGCILAVGWLGTCIAVLVNSIKSAEENQVQAGVEYERGTIWAVGAPCATLAALETVCVGYVVWEGFKARRESAVLEVRRMPVDTRRMEEKPVYRVDFGPTVQSMKVSIV